jgi:hypothetical protein
MIDEPKHWNADEGEATRAKSGADLVPYSSAAARAKSPPKPKARPVRDDAEPAQDDEDGGPPGFAIHHVIHHMTFVTPHPGLDDEEPDEEADENA